MKLSVAGMEQSLVYEKPTNIGKFTFACTVSDFGKQLPYNPLKVICIDHRS
jgi:hypothetical protein